MTRSRKELGAYYTPKALADIMATWAVREKHEKILEPSFGGCCFLSSTHLRLAQLGAESPLRNLFGADIDQVAFEHLETEFTGARPEANFIQSDFLLLDEEAFSGNRFDVVIGNPPYIGNASLSTTQKLEYRKAITNAGFPVKGKLSTWAFFVLHALAFLKPMGRIAWVLPLSAIKSIYGQEVLRIIAEHFQKTTLVAIEEELFISEGTTERVVVLLADNHSKQPNIANVPKTIHLKTMAEFERYMRAGIESTESLWPCSYKELQTLMAKSETIKTIPLSDLASVKIGLVTGSSGTFCLTKEEVSALKLEPGQYKYCLMKGSLVEGITFRRKDIASLDKRDLRSRLLTLTSKSSISSELQAYLDNAIPEEKRSNIATFKGRSPWYAIPLTTTPSGFIQFFSESGPKFVINECGAYATNSLYAVHLNPQQGHTKDFLLACVALSVFSGLGQSHAELHGGRYGAGALKMSLASTRSLPILLPNETEYREETLLALDVIDQKLRNGNTKAVIQTANLWASAVAGESVGHKISELDRAASLVKKTRIKTL